MKLAVGADHGGYQLKQQLLGVLSEACTVLDLGAHEFDAADDYPDYARTVAEAVSTGQTDRGILICGSGIGACIAANKVPGVRACLCGDTYSAHQGVEHDDMNVLCLGARVTGVELAKELVKSFLSASFSGESRHVRRLNKVIAMEEGCRPARHDWGSRTMSGESRSIVDRALADLERNHIVSRIWKRDQTVWRMDAGEIADRLGWLDIIGYMESRISTLEDFATDVRQAGFQNVVLLGMGGSSLGPEVMRRVFGSVTGYPHLIVLDSTVPAWIRHITGSIDPQRTMFLVSSKSGTTIEPLYLYRHFRKLVEEAVGAREAGAHFAAITDPGTPLARMADEEGFRRVFLNPPDIGGRYSVLSYFGMVPAALIGVDVRLLIARAQSMNQASSESVSASENPSAGLGAFIGSLAADGRDKLTLVAPSAVAPVGLWVEQLIAESTGKEGKGIVPVVGEPMAGTADYGRDRAFVSIRLESDEDPSIQQAVTGLRGAGHPTMTITMRDIYDLGAEFFRWEFATAVAGYLLGIHPFDQPDVQAAKDASQSILEQYRQRGRLPEVAATTQVTDLLQGPLEGKYLGIMAYVGESPDLERAVSDLREAVVRRYGIATTFGYGPRYLHSTGQLHKGGPASGLYLQILDSHLPDVAVPDQPCTFGVVADAQALGDLQALQSLGRVVASVRLDAADPKAIEHLTSGLILGLS